jgi:hypothetical protein
MSKAVRYAHIALIAAVISPPILLGQAESGTIVGTVRDPNGSVVPDAAVFLTNQATGFARSATTNNSGQYVASAIPTGTYTIPAEAAGFQKLVQSGIVLSTAKTVTADLDLKVGDIKETVEVQATAPLSLFYLPDCYPISVSRCYGNSAASRSQLRPLLFAVGADQQCVYYVRVRNCAIVAAT